MTKKRVTSNIFFIYFTLILRSSLEMGWTFFILKSSFLVFVWQGDAVGTADVD